MLKSVVLFLCIAVITVSGNSINNGQVAGASVPVDAQKSLETNVPSSVVLSTTSNDFDASSTVTVSNRLDQTETPSKVPVHVTDTTVPEKTGTPKTTVPSSTTTVAPSSTVTTSTTTTTTTTPSPEPTTTAMPGPSTGKWVVMNGTNTTCIVLQMAVQLNVTYDTVNKMKMYHVFDVPNDKSTNATGTCGAFEQNITLSWNSTVMVKNNFTLHFVKNETTKQYALHHFEIALVPQDLPSYNTNNSMMLIHNVSQFSTGLSNSYRCFRAQIFNVTHNGTFAGQLKITDLQFQAFKADNSTVFGLAKDCAFDTPDIVPIVVGCALAGLVIIVLIAYLVGRRRCQSRGYLSM